MKKFIKILILILMMILGLALLTGCTVEDTSNAYSSDFKKVTVINLRTNEKIAEFIGNKSYTNLYDNRIELSFHSINGSRKIFFKNSEYITYIIEDIEDTFDDYNYYESKYFYNNIVEE